MWYYALNRWKGIEKGIEKGMKQGAYDRAVVIARNLLNQHMDIAWISTATGLSIAEVEQLKTGKTN